MRAVSADLNAAMRASRLSHLSTASGLQIVLNAISLGLDPFFRMPASTPRVFAPTCHVEFYDPLVTLSGKKEMHSIVKGPGGGGDVRLGCALPQPVYHR